MMTLASTFRMARCRKGLTQVEAAKAAGVSDSLIRKIEREGKPTNSIEYVAYADFLGVDPEAQPAPVQPAQGTASAGSTIPEPTTQAPSPSADSTSPRS